MVVAFFVMPADFAEGPKDSFGASILDKSVSIIKSKRDLDEVGRASIYRSNLPAAQSVLWQARPSSSNVGEQAGVHGYHDSTNISEVSICKSENKNPSE